MNLLGTQEQITSDKLQGNRKQYDLLYTHELMTWGPFYID